MSKDADKSTGWTKKASIATTSSIGKPSPPQPQSADQDLTQEGLTEPSPSAAAAAGQADTNVGGDSLDFATTATGGEETLEEEEETNENIATFLATYHNFVKSYKWKF